MLSFTRSLQRMLALGILVFLFNACQKDVSSKDTTIDEILALNNGKGGTTMTSVCFQAVAEIGHCNGGEDILFKGTIEMKENITTHENGSTSITRHFLAKDISGWGVQGGSLLPTTPTVPACEKTYSGIFTGTEYQVQGGAEMFSIHFDAGGSATPAGSRVFIHQGTLVFVDQDGNRVVARHTIRKTPGGEFVNQWECGGK